MYSFIFGCAGSSLLRAGGFLWFRRRGAPLYLQSTGFSSCLLWNTALGTWALVIVAHGLSCSKTGGIFLDHPWTRNQTPCPLHWQAESQPVDHQGSPDCFFMVRTNWNIFLPGCYLGDSLHPSLDRSVRDLNSVCFIFGKVKVVSVRSIHYKDAFFFFQFSFFLKKKKLKYTCFICCISFCCTMKWISCECTDISSLLESPTPPLQVITEGLPVLYSKDNIK